VEDDAASQIAGALAQQAQEEAGQDQAKHEGPTESSADVVGSEGDYDCRRR
jgi:hypothetical protein